MRNPLERLVSHYRHAWAEGTIRSDLDCAVLEHPELTLQSCYAWQLAPYLQRFGPEAVLPVFLERLVHWPSEELARIARHVGYRGPVRWADDVGDHNRSSDRRREDPLLKLARRVPGARSLKGWLPAALVRTIESRWRTFEAPDLAPASAARLRRIFDCDVGRLGDWLGTSLSCEGYEEAVLSRPLEWSMAAKEVA
jgi:hypothetical protein